MRKEGYIVLVAAVLLLLFIGGKRTVRRLGTQNHVAINRYLEDPRLPGPLPRDADLLYQQGAEFQELLQTPLTTISDFTLRVGDYQTSIDLLKKKYALSVRSQDTLAMQKQLSFLAICYLKLGKPERAFSYINRALRYQTAERMDIGSYYIHLAQGGYYRAEDWPVVAEEYYGVAYSLALHLNNREAQAFAQLMLADCRADMGDTQAARREAEKVATYVYGSEDALLEALYYRTHARINAREKKIESAVRDYRKAFLIARQKRIYTDQILLLSELSQFLFQEADTQRAYLFGRRAIEIRDSLYRVARAQSFTISDLEQVYNLQLEDIERLLQRDHRPSVWYRNEQKLTVLLLVLFGLISLAIYFLYRRMGKMQRMETQLAENSRLVQEKGQSSQELALLTEQFVEQMNKQNEELETARKRMLNNSNQLVQSIEYAQRIQGAIQSSIEYLGSYFEQSFLISRPRDIVSGDLAWFTTVEEMALLAMIDCSGTGVAAASLSVIAYMQLNRVVTEERCVEPAEIVCRVQNRIRRLLSNTSPEFQEEIQVHLGVLQVDKYAGEARYASIHEQLFYAQTPERVDYVRGVSFVGDSEQNCRSRIVEHRIAVTPETTFYLGSDGYFMQLDSRNRKIGSQGFQEILTRIQPLRLEDQKTELLNTLAAHRLGTAQTDDITLLAVSLRS